MFLNGKYELYKGCDVIVDYKSQLNQDVIDYFEEKSNFEGFATLEKIDFEDGLFCIEDLPLEPISIEYLIVMNIDTNEFEYMELSK